MSQVETGQVGEMEKLLVMCNAKREHQMVEQQEGEESAVTGGSGLGAESGTRRKPVSDRV